MTDSLLLLDFSHAFDFSYIFKNIGSRWYFYVVGLVLLTGVLLLTVFLKPKKRHDLNKTQTLVYVAILSAVAFLANVFDIPVSGSLQISLIATVGFAAGYLFGGGVGFAVCFIGDLLGALVCPKGAYNAVIGFGTGLWGLIPGLFFGFGAQKKHETLKLILSFLAGFALVSAGVNSLGLYVMYGFNDFATLPFKAITVLVNAFLSYGLMKIFPRVLPKDKFHFE